MATRSGKSGIGNTTRRGERLIALFVLAVLLFNYPILSLFAGDRLVFGMPLLYVYLFIAWGVIIGLTGWILRRRH